MRILPPSLIETPAKPALESATSRVPLGFLFGIFTIALLAVSSARAQSTTFVTIAGTAGNPGYADGTNGAALFYWPEGIAEDTHSNLYVADARENTIRQLTPAGTNWIVTTIAGTAGSSAGDVDGTNGAASFDNPVGIAVDTNGNLYVGENVGSTIRKITPVGTNWVVTTIAGQPEVTAWADGTNGAALFYGPQNLTVDSHGNLYVADSYNSVIRKVTPVGTNWVVTTIAGQPVNPGFADGTNGTASFYIPYGLAFDSAGNLYVSDNVTGFGGATIRKLTPVGTNWVVTTIAGTPTMSGYNDGTNSDALFNSPLSIAADSAGNLYVADAGNGLIRKVTPSGTNWVVTTVTGTNAVFSEPWGVTLDGAGNLYVTDTGRATVLVGLALAPPPPVAAFSGTPTNGVAPLVVTFTNLSSNATNYVWNFGDGKIVSTASTTNMTETYTNAGTYTVILTANGPGGMNALTNMAYISVTSPPPVAAFSGTPTNGAAPLLVTFTNLSSNATNYVWNFGDGNTLSTTSSNNVTETYTNAGTYTVVLTSYGPGGVSALTNTAEIVVTPPTTTVPNPTIQFVGPNTVKVSWPATGNYVLQTNGDLTTPHWADYGGPVTTSNGTNSVTIVLPPGVLFFRLAVGTVQPPPVPNPTIQFIGPNTVKVSWPATGNYVLQTNGDLTTPHWADYGGPVTTSNGTNSVTIVLPPGVLFFRLAIGTGQVVTVPNPAIGFALNSVVVSWPATGGFTLQTNGDLTTPHWADYGGTITTGNGTNSAAFPPSPGSLFFRLKQ